MKTLPARICADTLRAPLRRRAGLHIGREAVDRVVGHRDDLVLVLVGQDREHRPEDLLARDGHVVGDAGEDRRAHIVAAVEILRTAGAARHQLRALVDAGLDQALDLLELDAADHGAEEGAGVVHGSPTT
jgi:hypothetical protein